MGFIRYILHSTFYIPPASHRRGFTLLEMIIFMAVFVVISIVFINILVSMLRVQTRQSSVAEVNQQSQFLLQTIQTSVEQSSLVEMTQDVASSTLRLRMSASSTDPTLIYVSGGTAYLQQGEGSPIALTSNKVAVSNANFIRRANPPGHDTVSANFTLAYNSVSPLMSFAQLFNTSVARVNAATFDTGVYPSVGATSYKLGATGQAWNSINDIIYFSGSNVGIGIGSPGQTLEVNGGMRLNTVTAKPACSVAQRGTFWVEQWGAGVKDNVLVCAKDATDVYSWRSIY